MSGAQKMEAWRKSFKKSPCGTSSQYSLALTTFTSDILEMFQTK